MLKCRLLRLTRQRRPSAGGEWRRTRTAHGPAAPFFCNDCCPGRTLMLLRSPLAARMPQQAARSSCYAAGVRRRSLLRASAHARTLPCHHAKRRDAACLMCAPAGLAPPAGAAAGRLHSQCVHSGSRAVLAPACAPASPARPLRCLPLARAADRHSLVMAVEMVPEQLQRAIQVGAASLACRTGITDVEQRVCCCCCGLQRTWRRMTFWT